MSLLALPLASSCRTSNSTRGQTGGIASQPQSIAFAKRRNTLTKQDETERGGYLLAFIEQRRRLRPVDPASLSRSAAA